MNKNWKDIMLNALSIDVEDYYHVSSAEHIIKYKDWEKHEPRVVKNTWKALSLLKEFDIKATFFVLGWVAERFPDIVREIHSQGHEIGCHGYAHSLTYKQGPDLFRKDVRKAKTAIENITKEEIVGFRAPSNSITRKSLWALRILHEEGFKYDSSIFPVKHARYGIPRAERFIHKIDLGGKRSIIEFPISTVRLLGANFAMCGGGYLRLYPLKLAKWAIQHINNTGYPAMVYFHPWEIDPEQPRMKLKGRSRFKHYVNLSRHTDKLRNLFSGQDFSNIHEVIKKNGIKTVIWKSN